MERWEEYGFVDIYSLYEKHKNVFEGKTKEEIENICKEIEFKMLFSYDFVFPDLELKRLSIKSLSDLWSKNYKIKSQIPAFLLTSEKKPLDDFLKLRENKKAMEFIYKLYFEIYCESEFEFYDKYFSGKCDFQTI